MAGVNQHDWYDIIQEAAKLYESGEATTLIEMARILDVPRTTFGHGMEREAGIKASNLDELPEIARNLSPTDVEPPYEETEPDPEQDVKYKFAEDGSKTVEKIILLSESEMNDPPSVMRKIGLDPFKWKMISSEFIRRSWQVTMKLRQGYDEDGRRLPDRPHKETNHAYLCKVRAKPLQDRVDQATIRAVFDELEPPVLASVEYEPAERMLEMGIYDPHFGKKADAEETGEEDYGLEIAAATFRSVIRELVARIDAYALSFDRILLPVGQDFFHIDSKAGTTTSGTPVDPDGRWHRVYQVGIECLVEAVETMRKLAPVQVIYVPGNHDAMVSFFATLHLEARYRDLESVTVDTAPGPRKYVRYGNSLIGMAHGKDEGKRIDKLMQVEAPEDWGRTLYREFHLGHLHHEAAEEEGGIIFRQVSAVTATDAWHNDLGWKGTTRKAQAFVWDRERGLEMIINVPVKNGQP